MTRINVAKSISETRNEARNNKVRNSVSWGRAVRNNAGPLAFAAILIVCSLAVGCSSEKSQPITSNNPAPIAPQPSNTMAANTAPAPLPEAKPAPKKIVHKRPATVTYTDKSHGVSFAYPRRYAIETGDATKEVLMSSPLPMNFVQPGGVALAAVELPETGFANTDFSSAFFNVSVNNTLTADQCAGFSVPQPKVASATPVSDPNAKQTESSPEKSDAQPKLMLGDLEMHAVETVAGEGTGQSDAKYFHVFQNGACYEFALNVTTNAAQADASLKHIDRDKVFARLQTILSTVKIDPVSVEQEKVAEKQGGEKSDVQTVDAATPTASTEAAPSTTPTPTDPTPVAAAAAAPSSTVPPQ